MTEEHLQTGNKWSLAKKLAFLFSGIYFFLYLYTTMLTPVYDGMVNWLGVKLHVWKEITVHPNGSGDTTYNYLQLLCMLFLATVISCIWWIADHKRKNYEKLRYWLTACLRYGLAFYMLSYGFAKIFPGQFPAPSLTRLMQPYGESSPMGLAWTFMGASQPFTMFTGFIEAIGGLLLLFRRSTMFGCLFSMTVLTNIVALNFCYDIPVKLFSAHLLFIAIFILSPYLPALITFFFKNKAITSQVYHPVWKDKGARVAKIIVKTLVLCCLIAMPLMGYLNGEIYTQDKQKVPLYGIYNAHTFILEKDTLAPLTTDSFRWQILVLDYYNRASVRTMNGRRKKFGYNVDTVNKNIDLKNEDLNYSFNYKQKDSSHILLSGIAGRSRITILLEKIPDTFLLRSRGFHWVNEYPFNR